MRYQCSSCGGQRTRPHRCGRPFEPGWASDSRQNHRLKWLQLRGDRQMGQLPLRSQQPGALQWPVLLPRRDRSGLQPKSSLHHLKHAAV